MPQVIQTPAARQDVLDIWEYIATDSVDAADRVMETILRRFEMLAENPRVGRLRPEFGRNLRSFNAYKYLIFYQTIRDGVEIIRVVHGARDLGKLFD